MKYTVHGISTSGWEIDFETSAPTDRSVWQQALEVIGDPSTEFKTVEQSQRVLAIHPETHRCKFCPPESEPPPEAEADQGDG